jgi:hypothetical protein
MIVNDYNADHNRKGCGMNEDTFIWICTFARVSGFAKAMEFSNFMYSHFWMINKVVSKDLECIGRKMEEHVFLQQKNCLIKCYKYTI